MGSLPRNLLLFLLPTCLAWGCNLNDDSLTGEEQALCFLTVLRNVREKLNEASRERAFSQEVPDNSNEEGNDYVAEVDEDDITGDEEEVAKMATSKRGKLDQNFLRFGRNAAKMPAESWKRAALDRNFLRFGRSTDGAVRNKRAAEVMSSPEMPYAGYQSENAVGAMPSQRSVRYGKGILSPEKLHLIRELSRKRGALERNFLRFGRSGEEHEDHHLLDKRAALDRNFLRFGRREDYEKKAALDRNFLRFGRNLHREATDDDFIDTKRAALDRNFLRFGKKDSAFDQSHYEEKDEDFKRAALDRNFLRFGREPMAKTHLPFTEVKRAKLDRNFLRFGKRSWGDEREDDDAADFLPEDKRYDAARGLMSALQQKRDENRQLYEEHRSADDTMDTRDEKSKRGALDKNFLRFGRRQHDNQNHLQFMADNSKRAALDRNFLRFGKRNELDRPQGVLEGNNLLNPHTGHGEGSITMTLSP